MITKKITPPVHKPALLKKIIFTVTNDLVYDQRMMRICGSLTTAGYEVLLVGFKFRKSKPLVNAAYRQKRLSCWFTRGKFFYMEYNLRLFFFLLFQKIDCICAIDLDTILPCYVISRLKKIKRVYDAHEYFTQLEEIISRPLIYRFWHWVERTMIPRFKDGYTVGYGIAEEFQLKYGAIYDVIRNLPVLKDIAEPEKKEKFILYQGAVNKGRGLDAVIRAMRDINIPLVIFGDGNNMKEIREIIEKENLSGKIKLMGMIVPDELKKLTPTACVALNPFRKDGLNQYLSLSNKFFDYIHAGIPQVTMNFPEYKTINEKYKVAILIDDTSPEVISNAVNKLLLNDVLYKELKENCLQARNELNWQHEERKLIGFYHRLFNE